jgi:hypothetical protein
MPARGRHAPKDLNLASSPQLSALLNARSSPPNRDPRPLLQFLFFTSLRSHTCVHENHPRSGPPGS